NASPTPAMTNMTPSTTAAIMRLDQRAGGATGGVAVMPVLTGGGGVWFVKASLGRNVNASPQRGQTIRCPAVRPASESIAALQYGQVRVCVAMPSIVECPARPVQSGTLRLLRGERPDGLDEH